MEVGNARFKKVVQTISYLPHFFSWVVLAGIVIRILSPSSGIVNQIIVMFGGNPINAGFDQIYNLYNPAVYKVADIIDTYVYRRGLLDMKYSFSSAAGLFKNIISFALVLTTNGLVKVISGKENGIW